MKKTTLKMTNQRTGKAANRKEIAMTREYSAQREDKYISTMT